MILSYRSTVESKKIRAKFFCLALLTCIHPFIYMYTHTHTHTHTLTQLLPGSAHTALLQLAKSHRNKLKYSSMTSLWWWTQVPQCYRPVLWWVWKYHATATTIDCPSPETVGCVWLRWKNRQRWDKCVQWAHLYRYCVIFGGIYPSFWASLHRCARAGAEMTLHRFWDQL